jgi:hypothetical protein
MLKTNQFSSHTYLTIENIQTSETNKVFLKSNDNWIAPNGDVIAKSPLGYLNLRTGVNEAFGDPFGDNNDY